MRLIHPLRSIPLIRLRMVANRFSSFRLLLHQVLIVMRVVVCYRFLHPLRLYNQMCLRMSSSSLMMVVRLVCLLWIRSYNLFCLLHRSLTLCSYRFRTLFGCLLLMRLRLRLLRWRSYLCITSLFRLVNRRFVLNQLLRSVGLHRYSRCILIVLCPIHVLGISFHYQIQLMFRMIYLILLVRF